MKPRWLRYVILAASGGALALGGHFVGAQDFILLTVTLAIFGFFLGLLSDRLASELEKVDRLSVGLAEVVSELAAMKLARRIEPASAANQLPQPSTPESSLPPGARVATILKRPGIIFSDGTVLIHTMSGYRQFETEADARFFLGSPPSGKLNS
jgi:hypothetical protein